MASTPWGRRNDEIRLDRANVGLNVGFSPFVMMTTSLQLAKEKRTAPSLQIVTWNTLEHTPLILLDPQNETVSLVRLCDIMNFLIEKKHFADFINMDTFTRVGRCAQQLGLADELLRCALADTNARPSMVEDFIRRNRKIMLESFKNSDAMVVDDMQTTPRVPITHDENWTDQAIEEIILRYLLSNTVRNDRMLQWYQHLTTSGAVWEFPMKKIGAKLPPVWDAATCTPDIPYKATVSATFRKSECWQSWLDGEFLVLALRGSAPRDREAEPIGALKVSSKLLAYFAPGSQTTVTPSGFVLNCFGKVAIGPVTPTGQPKILHYDRNAKIPDTEWQPLSRQASYDVWIGAESLDMERGSTVAPTTLLLS